MPITIYQLFADSLFGRYIYDLINLYFSIYYFIDIYLDLL